MSDRYITQISPLEDHYLRVFDTVENKPVGDFKIGKLAEVMRDLLNEGKVTIDGNLLRER